MTMEVFRSDELDRIAALPRRPPWTKEESDEAIELLTQHLRTPNGAQRLKGTQAQALTEASDFGRMVAGLGAGGGKTHLSLLLPTIMAAERTILFVPARLLEKTEKAYREIAKHWRVPDLRVGFSGAAPKGTITLFNYEKVSLEKYASCLDEMEPDLMVPDEAHCIAASGTGRTKRFLRHIRRRRKEARKAGHPDPFSVVRFMPMSGTFWRKSIREAAHLFEAALGEGSPLPRPGPEYPVLQQWSMALDDGVQDRDRIGPGALRELCTPLEWARGLTGVREALQRRILDTPGVIYSKDCPAQMSLSIQRRHVVVPDNVTTALTTLRETWELPNGERLQYAPEKWLAQNQLGSGYYYVWDPLPSEEWLQARKDWRAYVGELIRESPRKSADGRPIPYLDTPLQVWNAVADGLLGEVPAWERWRTIANTEKIVPKPVWLSTWLFEDAEAWAIKHNGIVWVDAASAVKDLEPGISASAAASATEQAITKVFKRIPYFGAGKQGNGILTYKGPCAASIRAHGEGKDLVQWDRALLVTFPSSGKVAEQVLARHHREGQLSDEVVFEYYEHHEGLRNAVAKATSNAEFMRSTTGQEQRLLLATRL